MLSVESSDFDRLPKEVLSHIFSFLSLEDRRWGVGLTCKLWNECSNFNAVVRNDKFIFEHNRDCKIKEVFDTLKSDFIVCPNLELHNFRLTGRYLSTFIWQHRGLRFHSISLYNCDLSIEVITNILKYCINLVELRLINGSDIDLCDTISIRCPKLRVLEYQHDNYQALWRIFSSFEKLHLMFPHLENINLSSNCAYLFWNSNDSPTLNQATRNSLSGITELILNIPSNCQWVTELTKISALRLTRFETMYDGPLTDQKILCDFVKAQDKLNRICLTVFCWRLEEECYESACNLQISFLFFILRNSPELRSLSFRSDYIRPLQGPEISEFLGLISKMNTLEGINLTTMLATLSTFQSQNLLLSPNNNIQYLNLKVNPNIVKITTRLLDNCPQIRHLEIDCFFFDIVNSLRRLVNLQSLVIHDFILPACSRNSVSLPKLKYLEIDGRFFDLRCFLNIFHLPEVKSIALPVWMSRYTGGFIRNNSHEVAIKLIRFHLSTLKDFIDRYPSMREIVALKRRYSDSFDCYDIINYNPMMKKVVKFRRKIDFQKEIRKCWQMKINQ